MSSPPPRSAGEEPPIIKKTRKKKKKNKKKKKPSSEQSQQSISILSLPQDLLLSCLARISRLHYPYLSLVSKRFRSLLASPELYKTRSHIGRTESCLYVCLSFSFGNSNPSWFSLCQKPSRTNKNKNKKKKKSSGNLLVPIPSLSSGQAPTAGVVSVGSCIYVIGGPINDSPSSDVWVYDCHCLVWRKAPSMRVKREYTTANVFDGKVYVVGGCKGANSTNWMEVFDPKTQTWEPVVCPLADRCKRFKSCVDKCAVIEGSIFYRFLNKEGVSYTPKEDRWETVEISAWDSVGDWFSDCVVDNVLYRFSFPSELNWYSFESQCWMDLKGLERLPVRIGGYSRVELVDYGGKLAVFWTKNLRGNAEMMIWCAVVVLERRNDDEIWATVEQLDPVLKVSRSFSLVSVHAATA